MNCTVESKKQVALSKIVSASIIDTYGDIGRMEQRNSHWAARGLRKLYAEALPNIRHKAWIPVNSNTHTATLPLDFYKETFVGFVDKKWHKVPLPINNRITDTINIVDVPCDSPCAKCGQDTNICNDLVVTEETNIIVINSSTYEQTIIKKLYPNGDYYLETSTPVLNIQTNDVDYAKKKEFIVNFDLKPCGCLDTTQLNTTNLQNFCPDIYCNYFASCVSKCCTDYGGYKIFEESGLIQMDQSYPFDKVYIEYNGFISKINGQYYVPMVAFETLVEWTKFKTIQNKLNVPNTTIQLWFESYKRERRNMMKVLGKVRLTQIMQAFTRLPKFDIDYRYSEWAGCFNNATAGVAAATAAATTSANTDCCTTTTFINRTAFTLAVKVDGNPGSPVNGQSTYQNNLLKNSLDVNYLFLAKTIYTKLDGDFTIDPATGIIDILPNTFFTGDSLIVNYNKNI